MRKLVLCIIFLLPNLGFAQDSLDIQQTDSAHEHHNFFDQLVNDQELNKGFAVSSIFIDSTENLFNTPFYAQTPGHTNFTLDADFNNLGWLPNNYWPAKRLYSGLTPDYPIVVAKYSYGMSDAHWFESSLYRPIGNSNVHAQYQRISNVEYLPNSGIKQLNFNIGFDLSTNHNLFKVDFFRNNQEKEENGGIKEMDELADAIDVTSQVQGFLRGASNTVFNQGFILSNELDLIQIGQNDSAKINSKKLSLILGAERSTNRFLYTATQADLDSSFYNNIYIDSTQTFDSIGFIQTSAKAGLKYRWSNGFLTSGLQYDDFDMDVLDQSWYYLKAQNEMLKFNASYILTGRKQGQIETSLSNTFYKETKKTIKWEVHFNSIVPEYNYQYYFGNHHLWLNYFKNQKVAGGQFSYGQPLFGHLNLKANYDMVTDYIYMDNQLVLQQVQGPVHNVKLEVQHQWISKHLGVYSTLKYRKANLDIIRIPQFEVRNVLEGKITWRTVPISFGTVLSYFSSYDGLGYDPAVRMYHLSEGFKVGGFPLLDAYMVVRLGAADLFIRYENILYSAWNKDMYVGAYQPIAQPFLRFGFNWNLIN